LKSAGWKAPGKRNAEHEDSETPENLTLEMGRAERTRPSPTIQNVHTPLETNSLSYAEEELRGQRGPGLQNMPPKKFWKKFKHSDHEDSFQP